MTSTDIKIWESEGMCGRSANWGPICLLLLSFLFPFDMEARGGEPTTLRVISYNVQFLPGPAQLFNERGNDSYRPKRLGEVLSDYDIVGLNEVFQLAPRKVILDQIKEAWGEQFYVYECPEPDPTARRYNAGLAIVSRYPIIESHHIAYSVSSTIKQFGVFADEFAAKGAIHARIRLSSTPVTCDVDVFVTHLDSKLESARKVQVEEIAQFAKEHAAPENTAIFMGDFNTHGNSADQKEEGSEYNGMMQRLHAFRPSLQDVWVVVGEGEGGTTRQSKANGGNRIDYVFLAPPVTGPSVLRPKKAEVHPFLDERVEALSDHSAVEVDFELVYP